MYALIGDIVGSRKVKSRDALQRQWLAALVSVNSIPNPHRLTEWTLTRGEEVEAAYDSSKGLLTDCWRLLAAISPYRVRIALGVGPITTQATSRDPLMMDGPAFHAARQLINTLPPRTAVAIADAGGADFDVQNDMLRLITESMRTWKATRWNVMEYKRQRLSAADIAQRLDISSVSVYKNLGSGLIESILRLTEYLESSIQSRTG